MASNDPKSSLTMVKKEFRKHSRARQFVSYNKKGH